MKHGATLLVPAAGLLLIAGLPLALAGGWAGTDTNRADTGCAGDTVTTATPVPEVPGWTAEQTGNAAAIIDAGATLNLPQRDQTIGVMTAIGESSLRVLNHGDKAGPDSRGLFQQRDPWGSLEDRMDPTKSALLFFDALIAAFPGGTDGLAPTQVAHRVQRNANPDHYTPYWEPAVQLVAALTGATGCPGPADSVPVDGEWTQPLHPGPGHISSPYGWRIHPIRNTRSFHNGTDLPSPCGTPVYAATNGTVTYTGYDTMSGWYIRLDHPDNITTEYLHMPSAASFLVKVGQTVTTGQRIGSVGTSGSSTGCHLHYMILIDGHTTDPVPFMTQKGAPLT